jgi:hypothetical protein
MRCEVPLRRAGTHRHYVDPGPAAHHAEDGALRSIRGTRAVRILPVGLNCRSDVNLNRHCEERSDEAIQSACVALDCFALLAMTKRYTAAAFSEVAADA